MVEDFGVEVGLADLDVAAGLIGDLAAGCDLGFGVVATGFDAGVAGFVVAAAGVVFGDDAAGLDRVAVLAAATGVAAVFVVAASSFFVVVGLAATAVLSLLADAGAVAAGTAAYP